MFHATGRAFILRKCYYASYIVSGEEFDICVSTMNIFNADGFCHMISMSTHIALFQSYSTNSEDRHEFIESIRTIKTKQTCGSRGEEFPLYVKACFKCVTRLPTYIGESYFIHRAIFLHSESNACRHGFEIHTANMF